MMIQHATRQTKMFKMLLRYLDNCGICTRCVGMSPFIGELFVYRVRRSEMQTCKASEEAQQQPNLKALDILISPQYNKIYTSVHT